MSPELIAQGSVTANPAIDHLRNYRQRRYQCPERRPVQSQTDVLAPESTVRRLEQWSPRNRRIKIPHQMRKLPKPQASRSEHEERRVRLLRRMSPLRYFRFRIA